MSVQNFEKPLFIGCTPLNDRNNRYMKWNSHGIIRHFNNEDTNQINIKFHDTSIHSSIEFTNDKEYSYADLSSNGVIFASSKILHCLHFDKQFEENEWSIHLNKGEQIKAVCLGEQFIAVATNNRTLRMFSLDGTQHQLIAIPGPIQCLVASNRTLVVVYHRQLPLPDCQSLDAMIFEIDLESNLIRNLDFSPIQLSLSYRSNLRWIGFTDEGTLALFDSSGSLKLFKNVFGLNWIEVANLFDQIDDNLVENVFIISVSDLQQSVRCVLCHKTRYPSPESIPVMQNLKFNLNLCKTSSEVNELEENNILSNVKCSMLNSLADHDIDTAYQVKETLKKQVDSLFKIFQDANKNNNEMRQLDSAKLIPSLKTIESLIKYSEQSRMVGLLPKLNELIETKRNHNEEPISLYTALPNKQSILQQNEMHSEADVLTPLIIDRSTFDRQAEIKEERILDSIEPNRFDLDEPKIVEESTSAGDQEEEDDLLKIVTSDEIKNDIKNPFKV